MTWLRQRSSNHFFPLSLYRVCMLAPSQREANGESWILLGSVRLAPPSRHCHESAKRLLRAAMRADQETTRGAKVLAMEL